MFKHVSQRDYPEAPDMPVCSGPWAPGPLFLGPGPFISGPFLFWAHFLFWALGPAYYPFVAYYPAHCPLDLNRCPYCILISCNLVRMSANVCLGPFRAQFGPGPGPAQITTENLPRNIVGQKWTPNRRVFDPDMSRFSGCQFSKMFPNGTTPKHMTCMRLALAYLAHLASHRPRSPCLHQQQQQRRSAPPGRRRRPGLLLRGAGKASEAEARRGEPSKPRPD